MQQWRNLRAISAVTFEACKTKTSHKTASNILKNKKAQNNFFWQLQFLPPAPRSSLIFIVITFCFCFFHHFCKT